MKTDFFLIAIFACCLAFGITSCDKEDDLPPIGGFNSSDDIAASNLVAKWSFEDNWKETKTGALPSKQKNNTFVAGAKGKAANLAEGYLVYPMSIAGDKLPSFTVSAWVKMSNNGKFTQIFGLTETTSPDIWGHINLNAETGWFPATSDTLVPKILMRPWIDNDYRGQDNRPDPNGTPAVGVFKQAGNWCHIVARWDQTTSKLEVFGNGAIISNLAWAERTYNGSKIGALTFKPTAAAVFGSLCSSELGNFSSALPDWSKLFTGSIDETRVYSKALTDGEVSALYQLELAGR